MLEILTKSPNRTQPVVRRVVSDSYALSPRSAIARCLRSMGESAMGESMSVGRLEFLVKTTISHRVRGVVGHALHEFGDSVQKLKNVRKFD